MLCYCANLKAIKYESTSLDRIVGDKSHRVIVAKVVLTFPALFPIESAVSGFRGEQRP